MRLQNFANEEFGSTELWAGFGKEFLKPIGLNETKEMLVARFEKVPVRKTYTCDPDEFGYLDQPQNKLRVPMHYVLKNDKADNLGAAAAAGWQGAHLHRGDRTRTKPRRSSAKTGANSRPIDDEMRLYLGVAQDIVVKRTIDKNENQRIAGNLFNQNVVVKYEIENFKDQPVTLDVVGEPAARPQRSPRRHRPRRAMGTGQGHHLRRRPRQGKEHLRAAACSTSSFPPATRTAKPKVIQKLNVTLKNEW